jgi:hypothetical protein
MALINADGRDVTSETIADVKKVMGGGEGLEKANTVTTSTGLVAYDLEAPAKNLYPILTPIRNRIPRSTRGAGAGTGPNWKQVDSIAAGGVTSMPWVPEGQRAPRMSVSTSNKSASYVTIGLETDVTFEAQSAGNGFEDVLSTSGTRLLQQTMTLEEFAILGGNASVDLGTPVTPTLSASGSGATLPGAPTTYSVAVFGLTLEGYLAASIAGGIKRQVTVTGMDSKTYTLNGGSSKASSTATQAVTLGQTLFCSTTAIKGAIAYAWFVGTVGSEKLEAITTINSAAFSAALAGTGQTLASITDGTTDRSKNSDKAFDGLLYTAFNSSLAYYKAMATGTAGTGTGLTASGRGSISEIDVALKFFWDNYRLSPDEIYVNAQELKNITNKVLTGSGTPVVRFNFDVNMQNPSVVAGQVVGYYFNPFSVNGGQLVPIRLHPNLPPGTMFFWCQNLPAYYESANVPQCCEVQCRRDYYQIPWPIITRANETGVYAEEVLKVYAPFCLGVITNIADA